MGECAIILNFIDEKNHSEDVSNSFRFETNAQRFEIEYEVQNISMNLLQYVGTTTRVGICVMYKRPHEKNWSNIDSYAYDSPVTIDMSRFIEKNENYEILIYPPIFSSLSKLRVHISDEYYASISSFIPDKNIVVAGGPHSFGLGCTTVNNIFSNILERKIDAELYNLSYNNKNYLRLIKNYYMNNNPPIADVGILELDYFPQNESFIEEDLPQVINLMKKKCKYLIGWYAIPNKKSFKKIIANNIIRNFIYSEEITVVDMSYIYDDHHKDMCVYNNWFINDSGNLLIYKKLIEEIRRLTRWNI